MIDKPGQLDLKNFSDHAFMNSLCDVLQEFIDPNVKIVAVNMIQNADRRILVFHYSRVDVGIQNRQQGRDSMFGNKHPLEVSMPIWNTHVDTDQILAKFALVR